MRGFGNYAPCASEIKELFNNVTLNIETSRDNKSGFIELDNYQDNMNCFIDVVASKECSSISVQFKELAIEECSNCECDKVEIKWGEKSSEPICGCTGHLFSD